MKIKGRKNPTLGQSKYYVEGESEKNETLATMGEVSEVLRENRD